MYSYMTMSVTKVLLILVMTTILCSCKKGWVFDKEMVIGEWRMWELYSPTGTYYWTFTEDSVFIYLQPNVDSTGNESGCRRLVYQQSNWNTKSFDLNLFEVSNPFDSTRRLTCFIDIARYQRSYLVIRADKYNWSASLSRIEE